MLAASGLSCSCAITASRAPVGRGVVSASRAALLEAPAARHSEAKRVRLKSCESRLAACYNQSAQI